MMLRERDEYTVIQWCMQSNDIRIYNSHTHFSYTIEYTSGNVSVQLQGLLGIRSTSNIRRTKYNAV